MLSEWNFSRGVRGKHYKHYQAYKVGTNVVFLDPDVAKAFADSVSVNQAYVGDWLAYEWRFDVVRRWEIDAQGALRSGEAGPLALVDVMPAPWPMTCGRRSEWWRTVWRSPTSASITCTCASTVSRARCVAGSPLCARRSTASTRPTTSCAGGSRPRSSAGPDATRHPAGSRSGSA